MADIRIKDLTTTASSTAADDFFAADGTTNGTRKLSAYSPSFGGNATVGGTLTVTGALTPNSGVFVGTGVGLQTTGFLAYQSGTQFFIRDTVNGAMALQINPSANPLVVVNNSALISGTTASTSTSSGALVVSGGVGVAGVVYSAGLFGNAVDVSSNPVTFASSGGCVMSYSGSGVGVIRPYANGSGTGTSSLQLRPSGTLALTVSASTVEVAGGIDLKLGNAYTAGAPTATGYIVIKDSTGTSYKIPAVAL